MTHSDRNKRRLRYGGFTLIELSIVLVVIGLLVGGVLVGRDLIKAAEVRAQISQIQDLETQITTFRGKYDCLPGDCINATTLLGTVDSRGNSITNGNGDNLKLPLQAIPLMSAWLPGLQESLFSFSCI